MTEAAVPSPELIKGIQERAEATRRPNAWDEISETLPEDDPFLELMKRGVEERKKNDVVQDEMPEKDLMKLADEYDDLRKAAGFDPTDPTLDHGALIDFFLERKVLEGSPEKEPTPEEVYEHIVEVCRELGPRASDMRETVDYNLRNTKAYGDLNLQLSHALHLPEEESLDRLREEEAELHLRQRVDIVRATGINIWLPRDVAEKFYAQGSPVIQELFSRLDSIDPRQLDYQLWKEAGMTEREEIILNDLRFNDNQAQNQLNAIRYAIGTGNNVPFEFYQKAFEEMIGTGIALAAFRNKFLTEKVAPLCREWVEKAGLIWESLDLQDPNKPSKEEALPEPEEKITTEEAYQRISMLYNYGVDIPTELIFQFNDSLNLEKDANLRTAAELLTTQAALRSHKLESYDMHAKLTESRGLNGEEQQRLMQRLVEYIPKEAGEALQSNSYYHAEGILAKDAGALLSDAEQEYHLELEIAQATAENKLEEIDKKLKDKQPVSLEEYIAAYIDRNRTEINLRAFEIDHVDRKIDVYWQEKLQQAGLEIVKGEYGDMKLKEIETT